MGYSCKSNKRYGAITIPILIGILPIHSYRYAGFLYHEVPDIEIPEVIRQRIASSRVDAPEAGQEIAIELIQELKPHAGGIYLIPAFRQYDLAARMIEIVREQIKQIAMSGVLPEP